MAALSRGFVIPRKKKVTNQASSVDDISSAFSELTTNDPPSKNEVSRETSLSIVPKKDAAGQGKTDEAALNDLTTIFSTMGVSKAKSVEHTSIGNERLTCPKVPPLRDYQIHLVNAVNNKLEEARRNNHSSAEKSGKIKNQSRGVLAYLPTGGGKTRVALELTLLEVARGGTVLFVVNRDTLAYQTEAVFIKAPALEGKVGMLCGSASRESTDSDGNSSHVTIATIQTLTQRYLTTSNSNGSVSNATLKKTSGGGKIAAKKKHGTSAPLPKVTLVIIDECHCAVATSYLALAAAYPRVPLLGLTATPYRLDPTEPLAAVFSIAVAGPSVSALVGRGFLVPPVVYGELSPCTQAIAESETTFRRALKLWRRHAAQNATHSEYSSGQSGNSSEKSGVNASSLDAASRLSQGIEGIPRYRNRATIAFCCSVMHSLALVSFLRAKGVRAAHVDGDTSRRDRDAALRQLKIGLLDVVS
jgi:superfamily II DNA or RNA helicase